MTPVALRLLCLALLQMLMLPAIATAHHGLDFVSVQTAHLPEHGAVYAIGRVDYISAGQDELEFEPAVLYGATDWISFELHAHFKKEEGASTEYESLAPAVTFRLTPRAQPLSAGFGIEYEVAGDSDEEDIAELTAMLAYERSGWMAAANLIYEKPSGISGEWLLAAGLRRSLNERHAFGVEVEGLLEGGGNSEFMLGYYGEIADRLSINAGLGTGIDGAPDWALRSAFIWQFR